MKGAPDERPAQATRHRHRPQTGSAAPCPAGRDARGRGHLHGDREGGSNSHRSHRFGPGARRNAQAPKVASGPASFPVPATSPMPFRPSHRVGMPHLVRTLRTACPLRPTFAATFSSAERRPARPSGTGRGTSSPSSSGPTGSAGCSRTTSPTLRLEARPLLEGRSADLSVVRQHAGVLLANGVARAAAQERAAEQFEESGWAPVREIPSRGVNPWRERRDHPQPSPEGAAFNSKGR